MLTVQGTLDTVKAATTVNLVGTYATSVLTASAPIALVVDGYPVAVGDRVMLMGQTAKTQNGIYVVTTAGSSSVAWVLTRASDFDSSISGQVMAGLFVFVAFGANANKTYIQTATGTGAASSIIIDTDAIAFTLSNAVVYSFVPGAAVFVVQPTTFGVGLGTIASVGITSTVADPSKNIAYTVTYTNTARPTTSVPAAQIFADVDSALAYYRGLIT